MKIQALELDWLVDKEGVINDSSKSYQSNSRISKHFWQRTQVKGEEH